MYTIHCQRSCAHQKRKQYKNHLSEGKLTQLLSLPERESSPFWLSQFRMRKAPCRFPPANSIFSASSLLVSGKYHLDTSIEAKKWLKTTVPKNKVYIHEPFLCSQETTAEIRLSQLGWEPQTWWKSWKVLRHRLIIGLFVDNMKCTGYINLT